MRYKCVKRTQSNKLQTAILEKLVSLSFTYEHKENKIVLWDHGFSVKR